MRFFKPLLAFIAAGMLGLGAAQASIKTQECFNFVKAQDYARAIQAGRQASRDTPQLADAHFCLGRAYSQSGNFDAALRSLQQAEQLYTGKSELINTYALLGRVASLKGDLQQALNYHSRELALARETGQRSAEATALNNIALVFSDQGNGSKALNYLQQSVQIEPHEQNLATPYNNLAMLYTERGEHARALEYLDKSIALNQRYGQYHTAARSMLNKGAVQTTMGQLQQAQSTLQEGLEAIRKVGDKYWEATAQAYLGQLATARKQQSIALQHYKEALRLARLTGATTLVEYVAQTLDAQQRTATALSYGVVEIGAKGVKAAVVTSSRDGEGRSRYETGFRKAINTNLIQGVSERGEFDPDAMDNTVSAVQELIQGIRSSNPNWSSTITIAGSSALASATNRQELADKLQRATGITPIFIHSAQELRYAIQSTVNPSDSHQTALLDIGSGNARIGYLIAPSAGRPAGQATLDMPIGSITLSALAQKAQQPGETYLSALNRVVEREIQPKIQNDIAQYPVLRRHKNFMLVGGAAWAMATLMHPENQSNYVPIQRHELSDYYNRLTQNPQSLLNQDLGGIGDPAIKARAEKEIASVKAVFTLDNLQAGARILKMVADIDPFGSAGIYFARQGNWAYGLAEAQALTQR